MAFEPSLSFIRFHATAVSITWASSADYRHCRDLTPSAAEAISYHVRRPPARHDIRFRTLSINAGRARPAVRRFHILLAARELSSLGLPEYRRGRPIEMVNAPLRHRLFRRRASAAMKEA